MHSFKACKLMREKEWQWRRRSPKTSSRNFVSNASMHTPRCLFPCYPMFSFYRQDMSNLFCLLLLANFSAVFPIFANLLTCRSSNLRRKPPATPWRRWKASTTKRPVLFRRGRRCGRRPRRCGRRCWWSWRTGSVGIAG